MFAIVVATLREHGAAVHRLAVSQDQSFFATASTDGTTKVRGTVELEHDANPRSLATYTVQPDEIVDACNLDNMRSVGPRRTRARFTSGALRCEHTHVQSESSVFWHSGACGTGARKFSF